MAIKKIGTIMCPVCGAEDQDVREDKNGKPYICCDECDMQLFARGRMAAACVRNSMDAIEPEQGEPAKPASVEPATAEHAQDPVRVEPAPKKRSALDDLLWGDAA